LSVGALRRSLWSHVPLAATIAALLALLATTSIGIATVHAAAANTPRSATTSSADAHQLKAVFIVGPTGSLTQTNLADAETLALVAESHGMDVRRVYFPHATWDNVLANIQGANLVVYMGHGYGFPSPYQAVLTESRQNGMGLNTFDGSGPNQYTYYGANLLREYVTLAPNAIVFLNHLCYSAGQGEPGTPTPTYELATTRVDNMANGWLATGAKAVFAYRTQPFAKTLNALFDPVTDYSVEDIFRFPGAHPSSYFGWIGWDPRKFDSVRTPGAVNFLDPSPTEGFYRAVTGDLALTASQWRGGAGDPGAPTLTDLAASTDGSATLASGNDAAFSPNGDGVGDTVGLSFTTDRESYVDWRVTDGTGAQVRSFSSWSLGGRGSATWDGRRDDGSFVSDGSYTITAYPSSRAGTAGNPSSVTVVALTTMSNPQASPNQFYPADNDAFAASTTLSVTLNQPATLSWVIVDRNNSVVRTNLLDTSVGAGVQTWLWNGTDETGAFVPDGTYYSVTTATTSAGTYAQRVAVNVGAFSLVPSVGAPFTRATKVKFFVFSAEPLKGKPRVRVTLPGLAPKSYASRKLATGGFQVTVKFLPTAAPGTATFEVYGKDAAGVFQSSLFTYQLN
jgi:flagellar hook assembly protein FlgD